MRMRLGHVRDVDPRHRLEVRREPIAAREIAKRSERPGEAGFVRIGAVHQELGRFQARRSFEDRLEVGELGFRREAERLRRRAPARQSRPGFFDC
jgi:hypothetical protein